MAAALHVTYRSCYNHKCVFTMESLPSELAFQALLLPWLSLPPSAVPADVQGVLPAGHSPHPAHILS